MNANYILLPVFAQVLLTFVVWIVMYYLRLTYMKKHNIDTNQYKTKAEAEAALAPVERPGRNFTNLFEIPVLFYVLAILLFVTRQVDSIFLVLMFAFTGVRVLHSIIHITYNRVEHRFAMHALSTLVLMFAWGRFAFEIIKAL